MKAFKATVFGRVQGVWFRDSTRNKASKLNVAGWVKNMPDGSVYLEAEGEEEELKLFEKWLHSGSPMSRVDKVDLNWIEPSKSYDSFEMRYE